MELGKALRTALRVHGERDLTKREQPVLEAHTAVGISLAGLDQTRLPVGRVSRREAQIPAVNELEHAKPPLTPRLQLETLARFLCLRQGSRLGLHRRRVFGPRLPPEQPDGDS